MFSLTALMFPIETVNWQAFLPTYPFQFNGPGYLFCVRCEHDIQLVSVSNNKVCCSEWANALANSMDDRH